MFGIGETITTWGNTLTDYYGTKYDKQENELAYMRAKLNRDYMNRYNSPEMQMQRLKKAGLNPNLVYGTGTVGGNQSKPQEPYNPTKARTTPKNFGKINIMDYADVELKRANINYIDEITRGKQIANDVKAQEQEGGIKYNLKAQELNNKRTIGEGLTKLNKKYDYDNELLKLQKEFMQNKIKVAEFEARMADQNVTKEDSVLIRQFLESLKQFKKSSQEGLGGIRPENWWKPKR